MRGHNNSAVATDRHLQDKTLTVKPSGRLLFMISQSSAGVESHAKLSMLFEEVSCGFH